MSQLVVETIETQGNQSLENYYEEIRFLLTSCASNLTSVYVYWPTYEMLSLLSNNKQSKLESLTIFDDNINVKALQEFLM
jgi:hypothetical protein